MHHLDKSKLTREEVQRPESRASCNTLHFAHISRSCVAVQLLRKKEGDFLVTSLFCPASRLAGSTRRLSQWAIEESSIIRERLLTLSRTHFNSEGIDSISGYHLLIRPRKQPASHPDIHTHSSTFGGIKTEILR